MTNYLENLWKLMVELSPWLLLGLAVAGILHMLLPEGLIRKHLGKKSFGSILKAVLIGIPMPLCSCGVIPMAIGLKKDGASNGAAMGFTVSTPQVGINSIFVSASFLGWPFALYKVLAALISGLLTGIITNFFDDEEPIEAQTKPCCMKKTVETQKCCMEPEKKRFDIKELFNFAFIQLLRDIYRWLIIGILIAAAISTMVPQGALGDYALTQGISGMFLMLVISMPMYICATSSVPLAASLVVAGMSPGAALVLLLAGPTTNAATMGAILKAFGKRTLIIYLSTVAISSIVLGITTNWIIDSQEIIDKHHHSSGNIVGIIAAVILIAFLIYFSVQDFFRKISNKR